MGDISFEKAKELVGAEGVKFIWLGSEPADYICRLIGVEESSMISLDPMEILTMEADKARKLEGHVFVCYHGNTSAFIVNHLKNKHGIESFNMEGGITSGAGEIF